MAGLVQIPLDGGGAIVVRSGAADTGGSSAGVVRSGPVAAGRGRDLVDDVVETASCSLRKALEPITQLSQQVLDQLREARPRELTVEFGVELTAQAGAVLAKTGTGCHLTVTLTWGDDGEQAGSDA